MSPTTRLISLSFAAMLGIACGPRIEVRTMAAPDAGLGALQTFRMLPPPVRRDNQPITGEDDPMISNPLNPRWGRLGLPGTSPATEGSVVIDVVRWDTKELLWRGVGTAHLGGDADKNVSLLGDAVDAIIGKFPEATRRNVAVAP